MEAVSEFFFGPPSSSVPDHNYNSGPPRNGTKNYATLHKTSGTMEEAESVAYIEKVMGARPYMIRSQNMFPYMYVNEVNRIQRRMFGWFFAVDRPGVGGARYRDEFYIRFLPSPLYEIEMQREHDMAMLREAEKMKVAEIKAKKDVIAEEEAGRKVAKELSDDEILRSFQKAKMVAEQNATVPPTMDGSEAMPMLIPLSEDDRISESRDKKEQKDAKKKEKEIQMLNSFLRNKERVKGLKSSSAPRPET